MPSMHKLIIQIPCFNEEDALPIALAALPREVPGYDVVEWLIIDDGSTDQTVAVALAHGVDHVVSLRHHQGLARGFMAGLEACLKLGADTIVNTDADNQYDAAYIPALTQPIVEGEADIVIGTRPIANIPHFSPVKKWLQKIGSVTVRWASGTDIADAPSGFRAIHRDAALRLNVFNDYTYTLETIIQAGRKNIRIISIPVCVNEPLRPSRLITSIPIYIQRSMATIFRIFLVYRPFRVFALLSLLIFLPAFLIGLRFMWFYITSDSAGHIQSLILTAILSMASFISISLAIIADLLAVNRALMEDVRTRLLRSEITRERRARYASRRRSPYYRLARRDLIEQAKQRREGKPHAS